MGRDEHAMTRTELPLGAQWRGRVNHATGSPEVAALRGALIDVPARP
jgi:hypothetical protein